MQRVQLMMSSWGTAEASFRNWHVSSASQVMVCFRHVRMRWKTFYVSGLTEVVTTYRNFELCGSKQSVKGKGGTGGCLTGLANRRGQAARFWLPQDYLL